MDSYNYFITFTLDPSIYKHTAREQLKKTVNLLIKVLERLCTRYRFTVELTKKANVHYHAIVDFKPDLYDYGPLILRDEIKKIKLLGDDILIDPIRHTLKDHVRILDYLVKDFIKTSAVINRTKTQKVLALDYDGEYHEIVVDGLAAQTTHYIDITDN